MEIRKEEGSIKISDQVLMTVIRESVKDIKDIVSLKGGFPGGIKATFSSNTTTKKGVKIQKEEEQIIINISVIVKYGIKIPEILKEAQKKVKNNVETMTDIQVKNINIYIQDLEVQ